MGLGIFALTQVGRQQRAPPFSWCFLTSKNLLDIDYKGVYKEERWGQGLSRASYTIHLT
jgi:hypothetical protein